MPKATHYNLAGKRLGDVDLPDTVFGAVPNPHVVWQAVKAFQANQRQGTAAVKGRADVSGGGKKPWRQKGTGRARQGSNRSPIWRGGGTVFGPTPRSYAQAVPRKMRRLALVSALSQRAQEGNVAVIEDFTFDAPKTKTVAAFMKAAGMAGRKVCFVTGTSQPNAIKSCSNLPGVEILTRSTMNVYDLVRAEVIVFTPDALDGVKEAFGS
jgi:large subunit ribosomal protein L4